MLYEVNYKRVIVLIFNINCTNVHFYVFYKTWLDSKRAYVVCRIFVHIIRIKYGKNKKDKKEQ